MSFVIQVTLGVQYTTRVLHKYVPFYKFKAIDTYPKTYYLQIT